MYEFNGDQSKTVTGLFILPNLRRRNRKKVIIWHVREKEKAVKKERESN